MMEMDIYKDSIMTDSFFLDCVARSLYICSCFPIDLAVGLPYLSMTNGSLYGVRQDVLRKQKHGLRLSLISRLVSWLYSANKAICHSPGNSV